MIFYLISFQSFFFGFKRSDLTFRLFLFAFLSFRQTPRAILPVIDDCFFASRPKRIPRPGTFYSSDFLPSKTFESSSKNFRYSKILRQTFEILGVSVGGKKQIKNVCSFRFNFWLQESKKFRDHKMPKKRGSYIRCL